jgi:hypothetical protein
VLALEGWEQLAYQGQQGAWLIMMILDPVDLAHMLS